MNRSFVIYLLLAFLLLPHISLASAALDRNLSFGARGADVNTLQQFLKDKTSVYPAGIVSGYFGALTKDAVKRFQQEVGITPVLGFVGPKTRAIINQRLIGAPSLNPSQSAIDSLLLQIASLETQLRAVQAAAQASTSTPATAMTTAATSSASSQSGSAAATSEVSIPFSTPRIMISGGSTSSFADSVKVGDVTFTNNSTSSVSLFKIIVIMDDAMNAPNSRGITFKLSLRDGTTTYSDIIEKKDVILRSRDPDPGQFHTQTLNYYVGKVLSPGGSITLSLWVELLRGPYYGGLLRFTISSLISEPLLATSGSAVLSLSQP